MRNRLIAAFCGVAALFTGTSVYAADKTVDFNRDVRHVFANHCYACHGPDASKRKAGLRLDRKDGAFKKLKHGEFALVPADLKTSALWERVSAGQDEKPMPPADFGKPLSPKEIATIKRWIAEGAQWEDHWAYVAPKRPQLPKVKEKSWPREDMDYFILSRLEKKGLQPSPEADKAALLRRVSFDLTGLPPTPAEVDAFLADSSPNAYEKVVDRLLASPAYGERMAVPWLDLARYADTNGYHIDNAREMWLYRDWVVNAFNKNMPFDQFTIEQLAGDLLPNATVDQKIASGFNRNQMVNFEGGADPNEYLTRYIKDRVVTTATVWLGTTIACTECHDHKYDPFTQKEFYQFYAFFNGIPEKGLDGTKVNPVPSLNVPTPEQAAELKKIHDKRSTLAKRIKSEFVNVHLDRYTAQAVGLAVAARGSGTALTQLASSIYWDKSAPLTRTIGDLEGEEQLRKTEADVNAAVPSTMVMQEMAKPRATFLLIRGDWQRKGEKVTAGVPKSLPPLPPGVKNDRLGLARWLVAPNNPLTARVTVNRYWAQLFGIGIVRTSEDFGTQGEWPSNPQLLDYLATDFMAQKWNVKKFMKMLVMSATYRQSSRLTLELEQKDPENRLLGRGPRFRLPAEMIRDNALAVSGLLARKLGGPSVRPYQPAGLWEQIAFGGGFSAQTYVQSHGPDLYRRSLYTFAKRSLPHPSLVTFDAPNREVCTDRRARTNTPLQALELLNDPIYVESARVLGQRVLKEGGADVESRLKYAFKLTTAHLPTEQEMAVLRRIYDKQLAKYRKDKAAALKLVSVGESKRPVELDVSELAAWTAVGNVLLNLDEVITKG